MRMNEGEAKKQKQTAIRISPTNKPPRVPVQPSTAPCIHLSYLTHSPVSIAYSQAFGSFGSFGITYSLTLSLSLRVSASPISNPPSLQTTHHPGQGQKPKTRGTATPRPRSRSHPPSTCHIPCRISQTKPYHTANGTPWRKVCLLFFAIGENVAFLFLFCAVRRGALQCFVVVH